jgi:uncharacterized membrane protein YgcG
MALLLATAGVLAQSALDAGKRGAVVDYAGRLDQAQVDELAGLIQQYERQTSIEFAVVVVDSLHGRSAREFAQLVGDSWGVGKAGRNNGIVLLWAPNERVYSLRIADGLSADISDSDAARITGENLLPNFKRGDYYAGLKETVQATMQQLGASTWEQRLQARAKHAEEIQGQQRGFALFALGFVAVAGIAVLTGTTIRRSRQRKEKLAELAQASMAIADKLRAAESNAPKIQQLLSDLSKDAPEQDITALSQDLAGQPARILKIKVDAQCLDFNDLNSYDEMVRIRASAETEADFLDTMRQRVNQIKYAKAQSQTLMQQLANERFAIPDVRDSSRRSEVDQLLSSSRQDYEQARHNSSMSVVDWLIINEMLSRSHSQVQQAVQYSQAEPYVPSFADTSKQDSSIFSFGGGGGDSSSSFGGGGGFSGGSGSDGSY